MRIIFFVLKLFLLSLVFLTACGRKSDLEFKVKLDTKISQELVRSVSFNEVKIKVFDTKCIACHDDSSKINLTTYAAAVSHLRKIKRAVVFKRSMPKSPFKKLTNTELDLVTAWIEAGGPDRALDGSEPVEIPTQELKPTFESIKTLVLDKKCNSCHSIGNEVERIPLVTREDLLNSTLDIVLPGNPDESGLLIVLETNARKFMPTIKSGITSVKESEKAVIRKWIEKGALD